MAFNPPPYPHDRLHGLRARAEAVRGGLVDASVGTPVDPMPQVAIDALAHAAPESTGYPPAVGTPELRDAASAWMQRRLGVAVAAAHVVACVGTKELVASLPRVLALRDPSREVVLYPEVSYPTYAMGAALAGLRAIPVPLGERRHPDLSRVRDDDADRALVLWLNEPSNPTGAAASADELATMVDWARERGIVVASDECYIEFTEGHPPASALGAGSDGVLAVHSLSKRSNMAGLRAGFVAGDPELVTYLAEIRRHAGMMVPRPVQAAAAAALDDDHVAAQRERYAKRRAALLPALEGIGLVHHGGDSTFYLWLRDTGGGDGWHIAQRLADAGLLVAPGDFYGDDHHARLSLTITDDRTTLAAERLR